MLRRRLTAALVTTLFCSVATALAAPEQLANLAHLDFLTVPLTPPDEPGYSTYRLAAEPELLTLWTHAEPTEGDAPGLQSLGYCLHLRRSGLADRNGQRQRSDTRAGRGGWFQLRHRTLATRESQIYKKAGAP